MVNPLPPLPFTVARVENARLAQVDAALAEIHERYGVAAPGIGRVVRVYLEWCSPRAPTPLGLRITAWYLAWFFAINDLASEPSKLTLVDRMSRLARGTAGSQEGTPNSQVTWPRGGTGSGEHLEFATLAFRHELCADFDEARLARYDRFIQAMFESFAWEIAWAGRTPSVAEYLRHRAHFVAVYPYLELWRLALGVEDRALGSTLEALEQLSVELTLLVNDLLSVERDERHAKHNIVFCLAAERGLSRERAREEALVLLDERVLEFQQTRAGLDAAEPSALEAYAELLGAVAEGTRRAMIELSERYPNVPK